MVRITYWTTACLEPEIEAVSKEVADLAGHFRTSRIFSVSPHLRFTVRDGGRTLGFHPRFDPFLRLCIPMFERSTAINHVYSEASPWVYLRTLRRRPIVLTMATEQGTLYPEFLRRCAMIAVQTEGMRRKLEALDLDSRRVRVIYPGVDLSSFRPSAARPAGRLNLLLATFPRTEAELESRGVLFLLEMAAAHPQLDFTLVSRPWNGGSTALETVKRILGERRLTNVFVLEGVQRDMTDLYARAHFTLVPYATVEGGKECPRSLVESLACGVPVLISDVAPFSSFVKTNRCGATFALNSGSFMQAVAAGVSEHSTLSGYATVCAQANFDKQSMLRNYDAIYGALSDGARH